MEVQGYTACRCGCGRLELSYVTHLTAGFAWECFQAGALAELHAKAIDFEGRLVRVDLARPVKRTKPRRKTADNAETRRRAHAAREAARKRLAQMQPELYDVLYADERRKRGLPVVPKRVPAGHYAAVVATNTDRLAYSVAHADQDAAPRQPRT